MLAQARKITAKSLSELSQNRSNINDFGANIFDLGNDLKTATKIISENFEKDFIRKQLEKNRWNISQTGENIGISGGGLHSKMKQYGLNQ